MKIEDLLEKLRIHSYPSGRDDFSILITRPGVETSDYKVITGVKVDSEKKIVFLEVE